MNNIHILPTDKPSRLCLSNNNILTIIAESNYNFSHIKSIHIYITSDEEIKEGDWVYTPNKTIMSVTAKYATESSFMIGNSNHEKSPYYIEFCRKIILTTDGDLIANGIQSIDDTFLEWFVKNPEVVGVEVEKEYNCPVMNKTYDKPYINYKIIISGEEPKQEYESITELKK